eukprot:TRINITY_DN18755_c0_g1_i1.p4 TRINITY_DN18755_c0_g1~~TRINITY_DN18755_c0_g1_i1.p4  ORF type:complete len:150 (-),score=12.95 TRINITY_DN18755_c0_g1_i1:201-650(-)
MGTDANTLMVAQAATAARLCGRRPAANGAWRRASARRGAAEVGRPPSGGSGRRGDHGSGSGTSTRTPTRRTASAARAGRGVLYAPLARRRRDARRAASAASADESRPTEEGTVAAGQRTGRPTPDHGGADCADARNRPSRQPRLGTGTW